MRRFKNGAFQLAVDAKVPVLPITFKTIIVYLPIIKTFLVMLSQALQILLFINPSKLKIYQEKN